MLVIRGPLPGMVPIPILALGTKLAGARGAVPIPMEELLLEVMPLRVRLPLILQRHRGGGGGGGRGRAARKIPAGWIRGTRTGRGRGSRWP